MKTIVLNGSPKGNSPKCNTQICIDAFTKNMNNPCEIKCIALMDPNELANYVKAFDSILIVLPLYIHSMPGIVMKFIEQLSPAETSGKAIGFIVQAGFIETSQHRFVARYFEALAKRLNYNYLGTVSKGEAAGMYMYPKIFKKVLDLISELGSSYERSNKFDHTIVIKLEKPYDLSKSQLFLLYLVNLVRLDNIGWHKFLKLNNAMEQRLDRPFL